MSATTAARIPVSCSPNVPRSRSHPSTRGRLNGSRESKPLLTSNHRAVSRTDRLRQPGTAVRLPGPIWGPRGMRPQVHFRPNRPQNPAGMRIEPPPSPPVAMGSRPPATAAPLPPDEPPGVRSGFHGLRVAPCNLVNVWLTPPNSDDVVCAASTAPASTRRWILVSVNDATSSAKGTEPCVSGQPSTRSSSLTPTGTPPKGSDTSTVRAASRAASGSEKHTALRAEASMAARLASSSSSGDRSPARKASTNETASPFHVSVMPVT